MQSTLAFAPTEADLDEVFFDLPVIRLGGDDKPRGIEDATAANGRDAFHRKAEAADA
jgi:hypothetical protein